MQMKAPDGSFRRREGWSASRSPVFDTHSYKLSSSISSSTN